ncbi:head-tail connector protein [Frigidibacter sp. ROC022]|uniref:head-tail connector protein n=1 Tax=Frigidibacter sp. ROC022 TaxID=2971796 RepID=UPI00215A43BC|nr:head-tail connector protein [Frigidibacter sp. ROC022]MCR8723626.1 head-tail connector protein [Frigidibacter sp. ROC022]
MMVVELTAVPSGALPVPGFRAHLRLGTGFGEDTVQDTVLESYLRAALAVIEGRTGKALLERAFVWTLTGWRDPLGQALPLAPVGAIDSLRLFTRAGGETLVEASAYRLEQDMHRPLIRPTATSLPEIPSGGMAEIEFHAGFGPAWEDVPPDLAQAVMLLAAHYHEHRHAPEERARAEMPFGVTALIERYRALRVGGWGMS